MESPRLELVYFPGCPNVDAARASLRAALTAAGMAAVWREWNRDDPATPEALRAFGSPTVLVDGRDVSPGDADTGGACCRVYEDEAGLRAWPSEAMIRAALRRHGRGR